jgi:exosortase K
MKSLRLDMPAIGRASIYLAGAAAAVGMKYYYSRSSADDLLWLLYPISALVELMTSLRFVLDPDTGLIDHARGIAIAPACAGLNFLIIAFCTLFFPLVRRKRSLTAKVGWLGTTLLSAYLLTICANSLRIVLAVSLYDHRLQYGWFTAERLHRIAGVVVYFPFLLLAYSAAIEAVSRAGTTSGGITGRLAAPFLCYSFITIIVPLLNGRYGRPGIPFIEHSLTVIFGSAALCIAADMLLRGLSSSQAAHNGRRRPVQPGADRKSISSFYGGACRDIYSGGDSDPEKR